MNISGRFLREMPPWCKITIVDAQNVVEYGFKCGSSTCGECVKHAVEYRLMWDGKCKVCRESCVAGMWGGWVRCKVCQSDMYVCEHVIDRFVTPIRALRMVCEIAPTEDDII